MVLQTTLSVALALIGSGGLWAYLDHRRQERISEKKQETAEEKALRDGVVALLRMELVRVCLSYVAVGSITMEEADALADMYEPYKILGGNGNGERLYEQAMALPRRRGRSWSREEEEGNA